MSLYNIHLVYAFVIYFTYLFYPAILRCLCDFDQLYVTWNLILTLPFKMAQQLFSMVIGAEEVFGHLTCLETIKRTNIDAQERGLHYDDLIDKLLEMREGLDEWCYDVVQWLRNNDAEGSDFIDAMKKTAAVRHHNRQEKRIRDRKYRESYLRVKWKTSRGGLALLSELRRDAYKSTNSKAWVAAKGMSDRFSPRQIIAGLNKVLFDRLVLTANSELRVASARLKPLLIDSDWVALRDKLNGCQSDELMVVKSDELQTHGFKVDEDGFIAVDRTNERPMTPAAIKVHDKTLKLNEPPKRRALTLSPPGTGPAGKRPRPESNRAKTPATSPKNTRKYAEKTPKSPGNTRKSAEKTPNSPEKSLKPPIKTPQSPARTRKSPAKTAKSPGQAVNHSSKRLQELLNSIPAPDTATPKALQGANKEIKGPSEASMNASPKGPRPGPVKARTDEVNGIADPSHRQATEDEEAIEFEADQQRGFLRATLSDLEEWALEIAKRTGRDARQIYRELVKELLAEKKRRWPIRLVLQ